MIYWKIYCFKNIVNSSYMLHFNVTTVIVNSIDIFFCLLFKHVSFFNIISIIMFVAKSSLFPHVTCSNGWEIPYNIFMHFLFVILCKSVCLCVSCDLSFGENSISFIWIKLHLLMNSKYLSKYFRVEFILQMCPIFFTKVDGFFFLKSWNFL